MMKKYILMIVFCFISVNFLVGTIDFLIISIEDLDALNYYQLLEVSEDASQKEIRKAYLKSFKKWHPDKQSNKNNDNNEFKTCMIHKIQEAYAILYDPEKRELYDFDRVDRYEIITLKFIYSCICRVYENCYT